VRRCCARACRNARRFNAHVGVGDSAPVSRSREHQSPLPSGGMLTHVNWSYGTRVPETVGNPMPSRTGTSQYAFSSVPNGTHVGRWITAHRPDGDAETRPCRSPVGVRTSAMTLTRQSASRRTILKSSVTIAPPGTVELCRKTGPLHAVAVAVDPERSIRTRAPTTTERPP